MSGKVYTFYSYKGGVGRSMAMANIGALLSVWGKKVLLIDWDLEAPGLENYFKQGNESRIAELNKKQGLIELLLEKKNHAGFTASGIKWTDYINTLSIQKYNNIETSYSLDILTAGRKDDSYIRRVRDMDYGSFYDDHQGGAFLEEIRDYWISHYDFILIDSRTGLTDSSGVCSIHMPDVLVMLFTATDMGFKGTLDIAQRSMIAQKSLIYDRYALKVLPIPTRFDSTEFKLQQEWLTKFEQGLKPIYATWVPDYPLDDKTDIDQRKILELTKLPYIPYFSYGESLPVIVQGTDDPQGLGYAFETTAAILCHDLEGAKLLIDNRSEYVKRARKGLSPDQPNEARIEGKIEAAPTKSTTKYFIIGSAILVLLVSLAILFGINITGEKKLESIQVDSLRKELDIVTLRSFFNNMDTNNIKDILELNKQYYASGLNKDTANLIKLIEQTVQNKVQKELEFTLPLIYQEIQNYSPRDLNSTKEVPDKPLNPIQKYFADTIQPLGPFIWISNERLQGKLNHAQLNGFSNTIEKESIKLIAVDSGKFVSQYIDSGNFFFRDTFYNKDGNSYKIPVTLSFNMDLKINKVEYGSNKIQIKVQKPTSVIPKVKPDQIIPVALKFRQIRVDIIAEGEKPSSRQQLQSNAIYEELTNTKTYLPRKTYWSGGEPLKSNQIRYMKASVDQAKNLQNLLIKELNINCVLTEVKNAGLDYLSVIIAEGANIRANYDVQQNEPVKKRIKQ